MTADEQQQVNAMMRFYEAQMGNITTAGAQIAGALELMAIKLKAAETELAELRKKTGKKPGP